MQSISANLNIMIKAAEKASRTLIRDFGEIEKLQVKIADKFGYQLVDHKLELYGVKKKT